jgi:hypothetical protein
MNKKKTTKQPIKAEALKGKKQQQNAADRLWNETVDLLEGIEMRVAAISKLLPRFRRLKGADRERIYDEIHDTHETLVECLSRFWEALPDHMRESGSDANRSMAGALGIAGMVSEMLSRLSRIPLKEDEFPCEIDVEPDKGETYE